MFSLVVVFYIYVPTYRDMNIQKCIIAHLLEFMSFFFKVVGIQKIHKNFHKRQYFKTTKDRKNIRYNSLECLLL